MVCDGEMISKKLLDSIKAGNTKKFYNSSAWKRKKAEILERDNHECQRCKAKGGYSKATTVHHIKHLTDRPDLALTDSNLVSLCSACHNEEHPEKLRKIEVIKRERITPERW